MPSQYSMASTVVAFRVAPLSPCKIGRSGGGVHAPSECRAPGQMSGMFGGVGIVHFEADDLSTVEIKDQAEVKPTSLGLCWQQRRIPAPDFDEWQCECSAAWMGAADGHDRG